MKRIRKLVHQMDEELESAKDYAECYLTYKAKNNSTRMSRYKEMATDELKHAMYLHDIVVADIDELKAIYTPPEDMKDKWEKEHAKYVECVAWIKQMMTL